MERKNQKSMNYHVAQNGQQLGELSEEQIQQMLASGQLTSQDLCWREGMEGWKSVGEVFAAQAEPTAAAAAAVRNPYAAPGARQVQSQAPAEAGVSARTIDLMRRTRPWVVFLAVLGAIGSVFLIIGALGALALGGAATKAMMGSELEGAPTWLPMALAAVYVVIALLYVMPVIKMFKYSGAVKSLVRTRSLRDLESALEHQRSFWKFIGLTTAVFMAVYVLIAVVAIGFGAAAAMNGKDAEKPSGNSSYTAPPGQ
jgi:hypothetical protein